MIGTSCCKAQHGNCGSRTGVRVHSFDRTQMQRYRDAFGFFRDRRPELYGTLTEWPKG